MEKLIIPCLDMNGGRVVKGINFVNLRDVGDPVETAIKYEEAGADELAFLDISATTEGRKTTFDMAIKVANSIKIPLTVGGGIAELSDIERLLEGGVSKVSINSAAVKNPNLIDEAAKCFGSDKITIAIDVKKVGEIYHVLINGGMVDTEKDALLHAKEMKDRGAGALLPTSLNRDGMKNGYDLEITKAMKDETGLFTIASGGAGSMDDVKEALLAGIDAALAASIFHFGEVKIPELKAYLKENGIKVRD
ncbi:imidazole glycerol phosphate synthase subunit HisF [Campylobacter corcagiensis]|uniref:imidazole glycerol-phosphate synthase n=1 Tax=Campylobacter corcagiensis TaxID=1448857 RepID=A0A7M1LH07_9BACT|nr:HisA/HisF-related TIM barrel protein [Campylobacter corcagiensis]QKF63918.1 imidazole glycerol phosphate synthase HisFH, HisF subunit [Campylobacter corcagiensis]QOQ87877.1 imidazole glycerol phosphate synthase subunit HisF [Campylobacter corcagiensis]